jgi:hypothetical protein
MGDEENGVESSEKGERAEEGDEDDEGDEGGVDEELNGCATDDDS